MADSKTLRFNGTRNRIGGTDMLFAKKYVVTVEAYGARVVALPDNGKTGGLFGR